MIAIIITITIIIITVVIAIAHVSRMYICIYSTHFPQFRRAFQRVGASPLELSCQQSKYRCCFWSISSPPQRA